MSDQNGRSPTAETIDGITIDLNRISARQFASLTEQLSAAADDVGKRLELSGQLVEKVITAWPFEQPITVEGYQDLGLMDSSRVDAVMNQIAEILKKKKLDRLSTFLPDTSSPSLTPSPDTSIPA